MKRAYLLLTHSLKNLEKIFQKINVSYELKVLISVYFVFVPIGVTIMNFSMSYFDYYFFVTLLIVAVVYKYRIKRYQDNREFPEVFRDLYFLRLIQHQTFGNLQFIYVCPGRDSKTKEEKYEDVNKKGREVTKAITENKIVNVSICHITLNESENMLAGVRVEGLVSNILPIAESKIEKFKEEIEKNEKYSISNLYQIPILNIDSQTIPNYTVQVMDLLIGNVNVSNKFKGELEISNCWIDELYIQNLDNIDIRNVIIENCFCRKLTLVGDFCVHSLSIIESTIDKIEVLGGKNNTLYRDKLLVRNSLIASDLECLEEKDIQQYRILQKSVRNTGDISVARQIKSTVLRLERKVENDYFYKSISWLYDKLSEYGTNPGRVLGFVLFLSFFSVALIFHNNWAIPALKCEIVLEEKNLYNWRVSDYELKVCDRFSSKAKIYRSFALGLKPIANPIGFFQQGHTVKPKNSWANAWMFFQWLFTITLITLFIVSIRGRFKLSD